MIEFAHHCLEDQIAAPAWHAGFLKLLPALREQLRFALRKLSRDERVEATAECIAAIAATYAKLHEQDKTNVAFPSSLVAYAVRRYYGGRRVGTPLNADDVSSPWAQKQRGFRVRSLDQRDAAGCWKEVVVQDHRSTPAEVAASRLDFEAWLDGLSRLKRGVAEILGTGETTKATARRFDVTPGRVSQIRSELAESWESFQAQALALA
jgi:hypothetical protein